MRLEDLRTNFLDIPFADRLALIQAVRADRLVNKRVVVKAVKAEAKDGAKKEKKAKTLLETTMASLSTMTPEQLAALAAAIQKGQ